MENFTSEAPPATTSPEITPPAPETTPPATTPPAPETTPPATTAPATTAPATTPPATTAPATTAPATTPPATTAPATTPPAPETPPPATPPPATPPPATTPPATTPPVPETQVLNPVGQTTNANLIPQVSMVDFLSVILTYTPWGAYYAGNIETDTILLDLLNRPERNAVITGPITKNVSIGNGATGNITSILGNINTTIEWPNNSIPEKYTICSITRYTSPVNNKRILTAKDATPMNDWIHGHKSGKRGVVYYNNEFKTNNNNDFRIAGELTDWVITCSKNDGTIPNNIYINGIPSGINTGGKGKLNLSINKIDNTNIINELSDFALSYVIIWDTCLSDKALKIVSDSLVKYLSNGEKLLFDMSSLTIDDKFKVLDSKSTFLKGEVDNTNAMLLDIKKDKLYNNQSIITPTTAPTPVNNSLNIANVDIAIKRLLSNAANIENKIQEQKVKEIVPTNNIINLNPTDAKISVNNICTEYTNMPEPDAKSFTESAENIPITSYNNSYKSYIWCKCNGEDGINNNTERCKAFNVCRDNYATNKNSTYQLISDFDKKIYEDCKNVYPSFPKYLEVNSLK